MAPARVWLAALLFAGCQHPIEPPEGLVPGLSGAPKVFTLANLHPGDDGKIWAVNFQRGGLIPVCSEVTLRRALPDSVEFLVVATGSAYTYGDDEGSGESFRDNLARYFGRACPEAALAELTPEERDAVRRGVVEPGMRKPAVIFALGYPPLAYTRTLELPTWRYWIGDQRTLLVIFDDDGKVEGIRHD